MTTLTRNSNAMNPSLPVSGLNWGMVPDAVTDCAAAFEAALAFAVLHRRELYIPAGSYRFSRAVSAPTGWRAICIRGEFSGSPNPDVGAIGTRFIFPGTDQLKIRLTTATHEQLHISGICFSNAITGRGPADEPLYQKGANPSGLFIEIDDTRPYNYPVGWYLDDLGFEGLTNAVAIVRRRASGALSGIDPAGFFGRFEANRIHTYRTDNSFYLESVYPNLWMVRNCRFHVGGTVYVAGSGGDLGFSDCHWENAATSWFRFSPNFFEFKASLHNCGGELNGDYVGRLINGVLDPNATSGGVPMHRRGFVRFDPGNPVRVANFTFTGNTLIQGFGEYPPEIPTGVSIANYGNLPLTVDPADGTIVTPHTIRVQPPENGPNFIRGFYVPLSAYNGHGTKRNACPQAPAGIRNFGQAGVNIAQPDNEWYLPVAPGDTAYYSGQNIPRTPDVTGTAQMFVVTTAGGFLGGDLFTNRFRPSPMSVTINSTLTVLAANELIDRTGEYAYVRLIRCDTGNTLTELFCDSKPTPGVGQPFEGVAAVYNGRLAAGYGCWHRADRNVEAIDLLHPAGLTRTVRVEVPAGQTVNVPVRGGAGNAFTIRADVRAGTARGVYLLTGVAGDNATKHQTTIGAATTGANVTLTAGDGDPNDMGRIEIQNTGASAIQARVELAF